MTQTPVTSRNARFLFYDLESLDNVFSCAIWDPRSRIVELYVSIENDGSDLDKLINGADITSGPFYDQLRAAVEAGNPALTQAPWDLKLRNLNNWYSMVWLARFMGVSDARNVCDPRSESSFGTFFRPVCDTDDDYDPLVSHPYLAGYNSANYDTTMLACLFTESLIGIRELIKEGLTGDDLEPGFRPTKPSVMRKHNDALFRPDHVKSMPGYLRDVNIAGGGDGWSGMANRIRENMLKSGRHIDISIFNETQQKVAFKRLLGGKGRQIMESARLGHNSYLTTVQDLIDLLVYNVADTVGLEQLFEDPVYSSAFDLKKGLLDQYPETRYEKRYDAYAPDVDPRRVRRDRLTPDSTSARFVARILAPYSFMKDYESVSFMYPAPEVAAELGITPKDVLEEARDFFHESIKDEAARAAFQQVYDYYDFIRGKNFNDSIEYRNLYEREVPVETAIPSGDNTVASDPATYVGLPDGLEPIELKATVQMFKDQKGYYPEVTLPYFKADGTPSSCFVTFSTGGIHGSEADRAAWQAKLDQWDATMEMIRTAREVFPDPKDLVLQARSQHNRLYLPDGTWVDKANVLLGSDPAKVTWRKPKKGDDERNEQIARAQSQVLHAADLLATQRPKAEALNVTLSDGTLIEGKKVLSKTSATSAEYRDTPAGDRPKLFKIEKGSHKLDKAYAYTSVGHVIHEDFTSYYPNMLRNMRAFYNAELGEDRYAAILAEKDRLGKLMKTPGLDPIELERLSVMRSGTKLILNSASGAGDTNFANQPIRVNNKIISMRLIGQLFSWMIGQAQTLAGARIVSTNTDGLYSTLDPETNNRVLAQMQARIHVEIEPEPLVLVSKDSNNRMELLPDFRADQGYSDPIVVWEDINASGASMACHKGPRPDKSLAHPAIRDWALARYLRYVGAEYVPEHRSTPPTMTEPLDPVIGKQLLEEALQLDPVYAARLFQNVIAASKSKITVPFAADPMDPQNPDVISNPQNLQHYNRVFYVKPGTPGAVQLRAAGAWAISKAMATSRRKRNVQSVERQPLAVQILSNEGYTLNKAEANAGRSRLLPLDEDIAVRKIPSIDPAWSCLIVNEDLHFMSKERMAELLGSLDLDVYEYLLDQEFRRNWMNLSADAERGDLDPGELEDDETEAEAA